MNLIIMSYYFTNHERKIRYELQISKSEINCFRNITKTITDSDTF